MDGIHKFQGLIYIVTYTSTKCLINTIHHHQYCYYYLIFLNISSSFSTTINPSMILSSLTQDTIHLFYHILINGLCKWSKFDSVSRSRPERSTVLGAPNGSAMWVVEPEYQNGNPNQKSKETENKLRTRELKCGLCSFVDVWKHILEYI